MLKVAIKNIEGKDTLIISMDYNSDGEDSKSGKTLVVASTRGNQAVALPDGTQLKIGVNCYKSK